jgi:hypothetical protein
MRRHSTAEAKDSIEKLSKSTNAKRFSWGSEAGECLGVLGCRMARVLVVVFTSVGDFFSHEIYRPFS